MKSIRIVLVFILFGGVFLFGALYLRTGFLQESKIDDRDLNNWEFNSNGIILGAEEFTLNGSEEVCWYLIHGYTSTPDEMREVAEEIHLEFNETVL